MAKNNVFYLCCISGIFFAFVNLLDTNKAKADILMSKVSYEELKYQWVVAEVIDIETGKDLTAAHQSKMYEFLSSGGFVEYEDKLIRKTGTWKIVNNHLQIHYDTSKDINTGYHAELIRPEELLLVQGNLQLRLYRLHI